MAWRERGEVEGGMGELLYVRGGGTAAEGVE